MLSGGGNVRRASPEPEATTFAILTPRDVHVEAGEGMIPQPECIVCGGAYPIRENKDRGTRSC
jgi:hypothetical protein